MVSTEQIQITNAGIGGQNSRALLARLDSDVLSRGPGLVALMVGTNDALNSNALVPVNEFRENLHKLTNRILEAGAVPVLGTVPPFHPPLLMTRHSPDAYGDKTPGERLTDVVSVIRDCAASYRIPLADVYTAFSVLGNIGDEDSSLIRNVANSGMKDGVHPTANGYALIAAIFYQAILSNGLPSAEIVCFGDSITFGAGMHGEGTVMGDTYPAKLAQLISAVHHENVFFSPYTQNKWLHPAKDAGNQLINAEGDSTV